MDIGEILGNLGFDPNTFVVTIINFLIVFFLLKKFVFDKITDTLDERQAMIQKANEDAQKAEHDLAMAENKYDEIVNNANQEANKIISDSKKTAEDVAQNEKHKAQDEIDKMKKDADEKLESDREVMIEDIKKEAADLAVLATEKIIEKKLDPEQDKKIISNYLKDLGKDK